MLVGLVAAVALIAAYGSSGSPAANYAQVRSTQPEPSKTLAEQSKSSASRRARKLRATKLRARTGCNSRRQPFVKFRWSPARKRGRAQRVDYTEFFGGFSSHKFHKSRKLSPGKRRWRTGNIETGFDYKWRVMTRRAHRWVSSARHSFDGPVCVD